MSQLCYFTEEMQEEQKRATTPSWLSMQVAVAAQKAELLAKLSTLSYSVLQMHDALFDPIFIKGLCLALDGCHTASDSARIAQHIEVLDALLVARGLNPTGQPPLAQVEGDVFLPDLQQQLLACLFATAKSAYTALLLGKKSYHVNYFLYLALSALSIETSTRRLEDLLGRAREACAFCVDLVNRALADAASHTN